MGSKLKHVSVMHATLGRLQKLFAFPLGSFLGCCFIRVFRGFFSYQVFDELSNIETTLNFMVFLFELTVLWISFFFRFAPTFSALKTRMLEQVDSFAQYLGSFS